MDAVHLARFLDKVDVRLDPAACWLWTGALDTQGYGCFNHHGRTTSAHRLAYEHWVGPVPEGLDVDHTCHNDSGCSAGPLCPHRRCMNPGHFQAVTHLVNVHRCQTNAAINAAKTQCVHGHPFDSANTYVSPGGGRVCRACHGERNRAYQERKKQRVMQGV